MEITDTLNGSQVKSPDIEHRVEDGCHDFIAVTVEKVLEQKCQLHLLPLEKLRRVKDNVNRVMKVYGDRIKSDMRKELVEMKAYLTHLIAGMLQCESGMAGEGQIDSSPTGQQHISVEEGSNREDCTTVLYEESISIGADCSDAMLGYGGRIADLIQHMSGTRLSFAAVQESGEKRCAFIKASNKQNIKTARDLIDLLARDASSVEDNCAHCESSIGGSKSEDMSSEASFKAPQPWCYRFFRDMAKGMLIHTMRRQQFFGNCDLPLQRYGDPVIPLGRLPEGPFCCEKETLGLPFHGHPSIVSEGIRMKPFCEATIKQCALHSSQRNSADEKTAGRIEVVSRDGKWAKRRATQHEHQRQHTEPWNKSRADCHRHYPRDFIEPICCPHAPRQLAGQVKEMCKNFSILR